MRFDVIDGIAWKMYLGSEILNCKSSSCPSVAFSTDSCYCSLCNVSLNLPCMLISLVGRTLGRPGMIKLIVIGCTLDTSGWCSAVAEDFRLNVRLGTMFVGHHTVLFPFHNLILCLYADRAK